MAKAATAENTEISFYKALDCFVGGPDAIKRWMKFNILRNQPIGLFGRAGIGKTQLAYQVAEDLDMDVFLIYTQHLDKEDIAGFPFPDPTDHRRVSMRMKNIVPLEKSKRKGTIILADEFNRGDRTVTNAMFTLMEMPRKIGDILLPDDARIVLLGNPSDQNYMVNEVEKEAAIRRRVCWAGMTVNHAAWLRYASEKKFHGSVVNYIRRHKTGLYDVEAHNSGRIGSNPASWEKVSKAIQDAEKVSGGELERMDVELRYTIAGLIGVSRMQEFMTELTSDDSTLISPEEVLDLPFLPGEDAYQKVEKMIASRKAGTSGKISDLCSAIAVTIATTNPPPAKVAGNVARFAALLEGDVLMKFFDGLLQQIKEQDGEGKYLPLFNKALGEQPEYKDAMKRLMKKTREVQDKIKE